MPLNVAHLVVLLAVVFLSSYSVAGCEKSTAPEATTLGGLHQPTLNACITELLRVACNALRPSPIKRNTELINSILGLPRVLQDAGR